MSENNTKETAAAENSISAVTVLSYTKKAIICVILSAFFFALRSTYCCTPIAQLNTETR